MESRYPNFTLVVIRDVPFSSSDNQMYKDALRTILNPLVSPMIEAKAHHLPYFIAWASFGLKHATTNVAPISGSNMNVAVQNIRTMNIHAALTRMAKPLSV